MHSRIIIVIDSIDDEPDPTEVLEQAQAFAEQHFNSDPDDVAAIVTLVDSEKPTCRLCNVDLPSDEPCGGFDEDEDGQHLPDVHKLPVPADDPTREIGVEYVIRVPNDDYDYAADSAGRLEQAMSGLLAMPFVSGVRTAGPTGSAWSHDA